jgi:hypothetical protein
MTREHRQTPHGGSTLGNPRSRSRKHIFSPKTILDLCPPRLCRTGRQPRRNTCPAPPQSEARPRTPPRTDPPAHSRLSRAPIDTAPDSTRSPGYCSGRMTRLAGRTPALITNSAVGSPVDDWSVMHVRSHDRSIGDPRARRFANSLMSVDRAWRLGEAGSRIDRSPARCLRTTPTPCLLTARRGDLSDNRVVHVGVRDDHASATVSETDCDSR